MERVPSGETAAGTVRAVERACAVLCAFSAEAPRLSLGEIAARTGLAKATAHRLAGSLVAAGFLAHDADERYSLGLKVSELGALARTGLDLVTECSPTLDAIAEATGETVMLAEADWDTLELTIIGTRVSTQTLSVVPIAGERMPMPPGAPFKALLSGLSEREEARILACGVITARTAKSHIDPVKLRNEVAEARRRGFVVAEEEYADGVSGVATPVVFEAGRPRATIGIVGPTARLAGRGEHLGRQLLALTAPLRPPSAPNAPSTPSTPSVVAA